MWRCGGMASLVLHLGSRCGELSAPRLGHFIPGENSQYWLSTKLNGPQSRSGRFGIEPRSLGHPARSVPITPSLLLSCNCSIMNLRKVWRQCKFGSPRIRAVGKKALRIVVVSIVTTVNVEVFTVQSCWLGCGCRGVVSLALSALS